MGVGNRIEALCADKGLSIRKLALKADVPYSTLYSAIKRDSNGIDTDTLKKIAAALGVEWYELISDNPHEQAAMVNQRINEVVESLNGQIKVAPSPSRPPQAAAVLLDVIEQTFDTKKALLSYYNQLNDDGQQVAVERVHELTEIPRYKRNTTPAQ